MIIALVNQKGGVGKSTLAVSLAMELRERKQDVLLVDADTHNRTSMRAAAVSGSVLSVGTSPSWLRSPSIRNQMAQHRYSIIDAAGHGSDDLTAPLMVADVAIIPCAPTTADAGVFEAMIEAMAPARHVNKALKIAVLLTKLLPRTRIAKEATQVYADCGLHVLRAKTYTRVAWQRCLDLGRGVTQYAPKSVASDELRSVLREVLKLGKA